MSVGLPEMVYADGIVKHRTVQFGGYDHRLGAGDGGIWDMENMSSDHYPLLATRKPRYLMGTVKNPQGFYARDTLYWVEDGWLYTGSSFIGGKMIGPVSAGAKQFVSIGRFVIVLPDMAFYNSENGAFGTLAASWSGSAVIRDGTFAGATAAGNTVYAKGADWESLFRVGDAVTITGCAIHGENNKTPIIREIEGDELRFYENVFTVGEDGDTEQITVARTVPEMDFMCENENRLWGCKGDTIYASKLGDPFNWNVFDGLSTDSFTVDVGSAGDFTGCCSYLGYPIFFKEESVYKVYGDKPSAFQAVGSASLGVEKGSHMSLAIAGEMLFYKARTGIMAYTGGTPQSVAAAFGTVRYRNAVGGSDGVKYFVSMQDDSDAWHLFVYDTRYGVWHREDDTQVIGFGWTEELYFLQSDGRMWADGNARQRPGGPSMKAAFDSMVEFGDFVENDPNRKGVGKIQIRLELEQSASVTISIQFDSDGLWRQVKTLTAAKKRSYYLPIIPRRCDHFRLRFEGTGEWRLHSLVRESYSGSELR